MTQGWRHDEQRNTMVLPPGWVADWIVADRLTRQLTDAPADLVGVVAPGGPLPPGSSFRTHAEHLALRPRSAVEIIDGSSSVGAVMIREGVSFESTATGVAVDGKVMLDHGTHAHDPSATPPDPRPAGIECRSPFPVRPIVVFLGVGGAATDPRVLELVNGLLGSDVEARLAVREVPSGQHLTAPCDLSAASLDALMPDLVVPIDDEASALVARWSATTGFVPVVELTDQVSEFEIRGTLGDGAANGTVARANSSIDVVVLAELVVRLASGPRPIRASSPEVAVHIT